MLYSPYQEKAFCIQENTMKKCLYLFLAALMCFTLTACGDTEETAPPVALTDIAAEPAAAQSIAPADTSELSISSADPLAQPMAEPSGEPAMPPLSIPDAAEPAITEGESPTA